MVGMENCFQARIGVGIGREVVDNDWFHDRLKCYIDDDGILSSFYRL